MPVEDFRPAGAGVVSDWSAVPAGTPLWAAVFDPAGHDGDDSYIQTGVIGAETSVICERRYRTEQIASVGYVTARLVARRSGPGGATSVAFQIRSGGQVFESPAISLTTSYVEVDGAGSLLPAAWRTEIDPATGVAWTPAAALDAECGVVDRSPGGAHLIRVSTLRKRIALRRFEPLAMGMTRLR